MIMVKVMYKITIATISSIATELGTSNSSGQCEHSSSSIFLNVKVGYNGEKLVF